MPIIKIDNCDYDTEKMSEDARQQVINLQFTDAEIARLTGQLAMAQTARKSYAKALEAALSMYGFEAEKVN